ncbi:hypothetical protein MXB_5328, partial [Myxobolus squamalis]
MSTSKYDEAESKLNDTIEQTKNLLQNDIGYLSGGQGAFIILDNRRAAIKDIQKKIDLCFTLVSTMEEEVLLAPGQKRSKMANSVSQYNNVIYDLQSSLSKSNLYSDRSALFGSSYTDVIFYNSSRVQIERVQLWALKFSTVEVEVLTDLFKSQPIL